MITSIMHVFSEWQLCINFIAHTIIFIGTFYIAMYNTKLPHWHVTPLWYVGLISFATSTAVLVQWGFGADHPMSFWNIGGFTEMMLNITLAVLALIMLTSTIRRNLKAKQSD